jgi:hypothetical protein
MTTTPENCVRLSFDFSRATTGEDISALLRQHLPEAEPRAPLDKRGAIKGYELDLFFPTLRAALDAQSALTRFFRGEGIRRVKARVVPFDLPCG